MSQSAKVEFTGKEILSTFDFVCDRGSANEQDSKAVQLMQNLKGSDEGNKFVKTILFHGYDGPSIFAGIEIGLELAKLHSNVAV